MSPPEASTDDSPGEQGNLYRSSSPALTTGEAIPRTSEVRALFRQPLKLETTGISQRRQLQFRTLTREALAASMVAKLRVAGFDQLAGTIEHCGTEEIYLVCNGCRTLRVVHNHCDNHLCPKCQPRLARNRYDEIAFWAGSIAQPKHVVLTIKNQPWIDSEAIRGLVGAFTRLRRRKFARGWNGGMWAVEITNEGSGWHIHLHTLIDARWIDAKHLAQEWAKCVGQMFAIVKVKDARAADYVRECAKYAVKGTDLAKWEPKQLAEFVTAIQKCRTFGTFGSLYKRRSVMNAVLQQLRDDRARCECGCDSWKCMSKDEYDSAFCTYIPPPISKAASKNQMDFALRLEPSPPMMQPH